MDLSKNTIIKIGIVCIFLIIVYNIISSLFFLNNSGGNFNSLSILINSSLGIILGFVIYNIGVIFGKKIGEYAGISKIIFDFVFIVFSLFYNNYLINLEDSFVPLFYFFNLDFPSQILLLVIYYSLVSPFWFQLAYFLINLLVFIEVAFIFNFFYILGNEKDNFYFKTTSVSYLISYVLMLIFYYIPYIIFYLSSILLQSIFLLISLQIIISSKIRFIEQLNPNYKPIHQEYE